MKQLGGIDASFLYLETPETPMHVAGLTLFEPPEGFSGSFYDHFRAFLLSRVHLVPIFGKKLARTVLDLDHPGWVDAGEVDYDYHLQHVTLPAPGNWQTLERLIGDLHSTPLDRSRPLWQFTIIDGLDEGAVALYSKVHHAAVDGGAGMAIATALYDISPTPRTVKPPEPSPPVRRPSVEERALVGINDFFQSIVRQQLKAMETVPQVLGALTDALLPVAGKPAASAVPDIAALMAPRTPFNVTISSRRSYAARTLKLSDAKAVAKATGAKLNDVVMAVCSGALRGYLADRRALPGQSLVAFVPISLREAGNTDSNNQVFGMNCQIATNVADPLERLSTICRRSSESKSLAGSVKDIAPKDYSLLGAPLLLPGLMQLYGLAGIADVLPQAVNLTISNTMGPPFPLFCAGARILSLFPVSIPVHGVALNITVQSYEDGLDFGITADHAAVPDVAALADRLAPALEELRQATNAARPAA